MENNNAVIMKCNCFHDYQDSKYGTGNRVKIVVHNKKDAKPVLRCTVCGKDELK